MNLLRLAIFLILSSGYFFAPFQVAAAERDYKKEFDLFFVSTGEYSYPAIDAKNYEGITLQIITLSPPVMGEPTLKHAKTFEQLTGAKVKVLTVPLAKLFYRIMTPFFTNTPIWDAIIFPPNWAGDIMGQGYLAPVPEKMLQSKQWQETIAIYRHLQMWGDKTYGVPIDGDKHFLSYRVDAFNNSEYKQKFKEKYKYDLAPPKTWTEYHDIAEFFTGWDWDNDGEKEYGAVEMTDHHAQLFWQFVVRVAPYAQHPKVDGGFFFDVKTMKPLINSPAWVRGLEEMVAIQAFYPPNGNRFNLPDVIEAYSTGLAAMQVNWDDGFIEAMGKDSALRNQVSTALAPGAKQVWNRNTNQWDEFPEINYAPFIAWGGWIMGVPASSTQQEAAFDFLGFMTNPENQAKDLTIGRYGVNPYREADFEPTFWIEKAGFAPEIAQAYTETLRTTLNHPNRVFDLRIPGNQLYVNALSKAVTRALAKEVSPTDALNQAAQEWDELTHRLGLEEQRKAYQEVIDLAKRQ